MTDPKKDDLQQNQKDPDVQGNDPQPGEQDQQLTIEGQEQQPYVQEEHEGATGHDIYASPLPKSQRPATPQVLEEPSSIEEEETPPPLPPREGISDVAQELEEEIYQSVSPESEEEEIYQSVSPESEDGFNVVNRYNGPSISSRNLIDEPYHDSDGNDMMEFEDNRNWESVRNAVVRDEEVDSDLLVTSGLMRKICDKIVKSKGNLSEEEVKNIVRVLETNDQGVAEDIVNPMQADVEGNPVREARGIMTLLHLAYAYNLDQKIVSAIENTKDSAGFSGRDAYNIQDSEGNLPLHLAARNCSGQMLNRCISNTRPDILNLRNFGNQTPMHIMCQNPACSIENMEIAKEHNVDFTALDGRGRLPLHYAAAHFKPEVLSYALKSTKISFGPETAVVNTQDQYGCTPLHCAVIGNNAQVLPLMLLQNGIDACARDVNGDMAIHHAVRDSDVDTVKALCLSKVIANKGPGSVAESLLSDDLHGNTPLHIACSRPNVKVFNIIKNSIRRHHGPDVLRESLLQGGAGSRGLDLSDFTSEKGALDRFGPLFNRMRFGNFVLSPVHCAIQHNNRSVLNAIFKHSPDLVKQESSTGVNSCHLAMLFGNAKTAKFIVNNASKEEVNAQGAKVPTPLHLACIRGNNSVIQVLVSHKDLDINQCMGPDQNTVLHYAINKGENTLLKKVLAHPNIDVNVKNAAGRTALHEALDLGDLKVVKALCVAGADASIADSQGKSALSSAIFSGQKEANVIKTIKLLVVHGATIGSSEDKNKLLEQCVYCGYNKLSSMLMNYRGVPTSPDSDSYPLSAAVICNNKTAAGLLIRNGGDVNQRVPNPSSMHFGNSLLMVAVDNSNIEMVKLLVQKNCDTSIVGANGNTVGHMLAENQDMKFAGKALKVILSKDAKVMLSKQDNLGNTPIHSAIQSHNLKMAADMMRAVPKGNLSKIISTQNGEGNTLLHMAAKSGDLGLFKLVISSLDKRQLAAVACVPNENGDTPLHLAMQHGNPEYAAAILKGCRKEDLPGLVTPKDATGNTLLHLVCKANGNRHFINYVMKFLTDNLDKEVLKGLVNDRNLENKTPMHCAASQGNKYASRLFPLCNTNTLTTPDADGNLVSGCISDGSSLKKGTGLFGLKPSLFKKILKAEADAKAGLHAASCEVLPSVDESPVEGKENDGVEILTDTDHSESLTADQEPEEYGYGFNMSSRLSASQSSSISSLVSSGKVSSASAEPPLASHRSSFSSFGKGSSSDVTPSGQHGTQESQQPLTMEIENIVGDLEMLSEEIDAIVQDMQSMTVASSADVDIQSVGSPTTGQSATAKKSSCHGK
ncbi:ankyrin repeat domain-containing protein [Ehrlichia muris]|uniref:Uncharacterized protein n=1 Tax=Ehrlichia muris AS145 TaxID=1423892 RepID=V9R7B4_9RICK|nr:ankyrin repeat domain-containing protein [Ehrlichia muris]AHC39707.1 hypothetical protein EMUR_01925 [Ehrlichia muris AS145]